MCAGGEKSQSCDNSRDGDSKLTLVLSISKTLLQCEEGKEGKVGRRKGHPSSVEARMYLNLLKRTSVSGHMLHGMDALKPRGPSMSSEHYTNTGATG